MVDHIHVLNTYSVIGTVNLIIVIFYIQSAITEPNNKFVLKPVFYKKKKKTNFYFKNLMFN